MEHLEIMEALKHLPISVEEEVAGLSDAVLRYRPSDDAWSIKETVGHLRDMCEAWATRIHQVWSLTDPIFVSVDGEASVKEHNYQDANIAALITEIRTHRLHMVDTLSHAVDWTRLGQQPGVGRRSMKQFAEGEIEHDANHLEQIRALKAAQGSGTRA